MDAETLKKQIAKQSRKRQQILDLLAKGFFSQDDTEWYLVLIDLTKEINDLKSKSTDEEIAKFLKEALKDK